RSLVPTVILRTSQFSWAETDLQKIPWTFDPAAEERSVAVGVAVAQRTAEGRAGSESEEKPRLVLFSTAMLAANLLQGIEPTNLDLLMNAASWLRGRSETLGIMPNTHVALTLTVDPLLRSRLILVPSVTAMMLIIALGIIVYVARRE